VRVSEGIEGRTRLRVEQMVEGVGQRQDQVEQHGQEEAHPAPEPQAGSARAEQRPTLQLPLPFHLLEECRPLVKELRDFGALGVLLGVHEQPMLGFGGQIAANAVKGMQFAMPLLAQMPSAQTCLF
jgi:hypothetical protein